MCQVLCWMTGIQRGTRDSLVLEENKIMCVFVCLRVCIRDAVRVCR